MKRLRLRVILLTCWLIVFYIIEHLWEPFKASLVFQLFTLAVVFIVFIMRNYKQLNIGVMLAITSILFLSIKALMKLPMTGAALSLTLMEVCAILLTTLLLVWVRDAILEFESAVSAITINHRGKSVEASVKGQGILYQEVRRARNHQRPLALMAIAVDEKSIKGSVNRMVKEAQESIIRRFTLATVFKTLCEKLEDCDVVVQANDQFLVLLPETKPGDLPGLISRLRQYVTDEIGVDLKVGSASLPEDGFTFEGLLDKATTDLREFKESKIFGESEQIYVKHDIT